MTGHTPLDRDRAHLLHPLHHPSAYANARVWVSGNGAMLTDSTGREYIDGLSGLWNFNVGHGRTELGDVARGQMSTLAFTSAYAGGTNERAIELAEKLSALMYPSINAFYFTSGGAEASETSFKTARFYWKAAGRPGKFKVISRLRAYHGVTLAAMSATGLPAFWPMFEPRTPGFSHVDAPDPYRFAHTDTSVSFGVAAANKLEEAILAEGPDSVAAFIAEPVQGAGGVIVPPATYWERIQAVLDAPVAAGLHSLAAANLAAAPPEEDALVCGDDEGAKELALDLAGRLVSGKAVDCGPLASARALEGMTAVIVNVNKRYNAHAGLRLTGLR